MIQDSLKSSMNVLCSVMILALLLTFTRCNTFSHKRELNTLDSLDNELDSISAMLGKIEYKETNRYFRKIANDIDSLKKIERDKKFANEEISTLAEYNKLKKIFFNYSTFYKKCAEELDYSRKQIGNLKQDVKKGIIADDKLTGYLNTEKSSIAKFKEIVFKTVNSCMEAKNKYVIYSPEIEKIIADFAAVDSSECE